MTRLHELADHGQSVWIDFLSRELLESGALALAIERDAVVGVTSNPTIFATALSSGNAYDEQIAAANGDDASVFLELAMRDVTDACDLLRPVWERTEARDGCVSPTCSTSICSAASAGTSSPRAARPQRCLWASTSMKDPSRRDTPGEGYREP